MLIESNLISPFDNKPVEQPIGEDGQYVLNPERLDAVIDYALNAENWNQETWASKNESTPCGTSYCIAGFAATKFSGLREQFRVTNADGTPGTSRQVYDALVRYMGLGDPTGEVRETRRGFFADDTSFVLGTDGTYYDIAAVALAFIGLNNDEAAILFLPDNDAEDIREIAEKIKQGKWRSA